MQQTLRQLSRHAATASLVIGLWVLKDAALYRFCRPSLEDGPRVATGFLIGQRGKVTRRLSPIGLVWIGGLTLIVEDDDDPGAAAEFSMHSVAVCGGWIAPARSGI